MSKNESFLILGGAGLVGKQIAREIARKLAPQKIVIASLRQAEVETALVELRTSFADQSIEWDGLWGNLFVRESLAEEGRASLLQNGESRAALYSDLFGPLDDAYADSALVQAIRRFKPDVIVDAINTATAISYQDAYSASVIARRDVDSVIDAARAGNQTGDNMLDAAGTAFDLLLLSQALPQLVRHIQMLHRAMQEVKTRLYLKIGTTGTGGMGLNIPYTHSEDKPSMKLMTKTAVAFAHTGLLFLMARTPDSPIVKELKPGAMIGYADVSLRPVMEHGQPLYLYSSRIDSLNGFLTLREGEQDYKKLDQFHLPVVDTGENGLFTRGEFETITALRQMEFITPEEIARDAVLEIRGSNSGFDVIAEIDSAIMNPTYRAGYLRQQVLEEMDYLETEHRTRSVAIGQLGPPEISKLLWEAELLRVEYGTLENVLEKDSGGIAYKLFERIQADDDLRSLITSIGLPILTPDGSNLIRGPRIRIPEIPGQNEVPLNSDSVDTWARKGWLDLRPQNFAVWQKRFHAMCEERKRWYGRGSAAISRHAYLFNDIRIGEVVGWIFNNEEHGYRIK